MRKKTVVAAIAIIVLLFSLVGLGCIEVSRANPFNNSTYYPEPVSPSITLNSPLNGSTIKSSEVWVNVTLSIPPITSDTNTPLQLYIYSTIEWVGYSLDNSSMTVIDNKAIVYKETTQTVNYFFPINSVTEGSHTVTIKIAHHSYYPSVANSTSPTAIASSSNFFTVQLETSALSPSPSSEPTIGQTRTPNPNAEPKQNQDFTLPIALALIAVVLVFVSALTYSKRRRT